MIRLAALRKIQSRSGLVTAIPTLVRGLQAASVALVVFSVGGVAVAKKASSRNEEVAASTAVTGVPNLDASAASDTSSFRLSGFRSAQFGASESEVRSDIAKDFSVSTSAIHKSLNLVDRTTVLSVRAPNVLADGGTAEVAYVFGYRSKKLMQVNVLWSAQTDKTLTPARLAANGELLKSYFASQGYLHNSIVSNTPVRDGILLFRGADADGHMTALILNGAMTTGADKAKTLTPNTLLLFYFADPKAPDVFKIPEGKF
jgi:hypothetical protein